MTSFFLSSFIRSINLCCPILWSILLWHWLNITKLVSTCEEIFPFWVRYIHCLSSHLGILQYVFTGVKKGPSSPPMYDRVQSIKIYEYIYLYVSMSISILFCSSPIQTETLYSFSPFFCDLDFSPSYASSQLLLPIITKRKSISTIHLTFGLFALQNAQNLDFYPWSDPSLNMEIKQGCNNLSYRSKNMILPFFQHKSVGTLNP